MAKFLLLHMLKLIHKFTAICPELTELLDCKSEMIISIDYAAIPSNISSKETTRLRNKLSGGKV